METEHLSERQCADFREQRLSAPELERAGRHLAECAECRRRVLGGAAAEQAAALLDGLGDSHIEYEELESYATGRLPMDRRERVIRHLGRCERCRAEADDLARFTKSVSQPPSPARWYVVAAALMLAVVGALVMMRVLHRQNAYESLVADARLTHKVAVPEFLAGLRGPAPDVRGAGSENEFHVTEPLGTAVESETPQFLWTGLPWAQSYTVDVFDENLAKVATSRTIRGTTWTPSQPLPRSRPLQWQVTAEGSARSVVAPASSERAARFYIVDAETAASLERVRREHADDSLLLGLAHARAGVLPRAIEYLQSYAASHPGPEAQALVDDLRAKMNQ